MYTTAGYFTAANSRGAVYPSAASLTEDLNYFDAIFSSVASSIWCHFVFRCDTLTNNDKLWKLYSGTTQLLSLQSVIANDSLRLQKYASSTWSTIDSSGSFVFANNGLYVVDIQVILGNPGTCRVYLNNVPVIASNAYDLSWPSVTDFSKIRFQKTYNSDSATRRGHFSEVIVADWCTLQSKVVGRGPDANGAYTAWTGAGYTAIDEVILSADYMTSGTVDQRISVSLGSFTALGANERIENVKASVNAFRDASGPQSLNLFTRISTTDYDGSDQALTVPAAHYSQSWATSPATATYWTPTELDASEFGVRSRT
jgi:hypothetical protein